MSQDAKAQAEEPIRLRLDAGDYRDAFERLLGLYAEKVFHLALGMLRDPVAAEDMAQDIFLRIWKGLPRYHGGASLSTWIYTIARNACLTELRKRAARPTISLDQPEYEGNLDHRAELQSPSPEAGAEMDAHELLRELPDKYRQVITLFYLEQKSYEQVGALLNLPLGTVKTFLYRAKKELLKMASRRKRVPV